MNDIHNESIPEEILQQADQKVDELKQLLAKYIVTLKPGQRKKMLKLGEKSLSFVEKSFELAGNNSSLCPHYLSMDRFHADLTDAESIRSLLNKVHQLSTGLDDTMMNAGSEAYNASLVFYSSAKQAAEQNVPGAKSVYEELRKRFPSRGKSRAAEL